jgi:transcriptional regulator with XRE-family HTH domain
VNARVSGVVGVNVPVAIRHLAEAGVTRLVVAAELGVHRTTVARWATGAHRPNARNLAALKTLVDELHREVLDGSILACRGQDAALTAARDALMTNAERADVEQLAARLVADMESYLSRPGWAAGMSDPFAHCLEEAA